MRSDVYDDLAHPSVQAAWSSLGPPPSVFMTPAWQQAWWETFGRDRPLLLVIRDADRPVVLAPLFLSGGMAFLIGSGGSDYLDFLGQADHLGAMECLLHALLDAVPGLVGLRLYHVPDDGPTGSALRHAAVSGGWQCYDEGSLTAPFLSLTPEAAAGAARKKSLVRHERWLRSNGHLEVQHAVNAADVLPLLPAFFEQHRRRWAATPTPSLFVNPLQTQFYRRLTEVSAGAGWLRFCAVRWNGTPVAFHFGMSYLGSFLWYKPSFELALARRSPGEVLLRQLLIAAAAEGVHTFDLGLGDEQFKSRFATGTRLVRTWGLYPPGAA